MHKNKKGVSNMAYGITSESQLIDLATRESAVEKIKSTAADFTNCASVVRDASSECNAEALSVEGATMQPTIDDLAEQIDSIKGSVEALAENILSVATEVYNAQSQELQAYQEKLRREAEAQNNE